MTIFWRGIEDIGEQIGARFRKKEKGACLRKIYEQLKISQDINMEEERLRHSKEFW